MNIVSNIIPLWYGDVDAIIKEIALVRVTGFEPVTQYFAPDPKTSGINKAIRHSN